MNPNNFIDKLKSDVDNHPVLNHEWLLRREKELSIDDLKLWLSQEYYVSLDFVTWFLKAAAITDNPDIRIVLVENIWEELGEGKKENSHLEILKRFLSEIQFDFSTHTCLPGTKLYLDTMKKIVERDIYSALGALGPANEYLLKKEYGKMYLSYKKLGESIPLPRGSFFEINLGADEGHSKKLFDLIESICTTEDFKKSVRDGNIAALDARLLFYDGLLNYK